jgi:IPT/TIG domain
MKPQSLRHSASTHAPSARQQARYRVTIIMFLAALLTASCQTSVAQENYLVATQDGVLSLYDLATNSLLESFQSGPLTYTIVAGPNNRLAFSAGGSGYGLAVDTSIQSDVTRLTGVRAPASTLGASGKYYLAADYDYLLDVVDTASLTVVQRVNFGSVIPPVGNPGAIVAANNKAYIFPRSQNPQAPKAAVVDLTTFQLSSIALPAGTFCRRCASRTPDGSLVVVIEQERSDGKTHVLLISTTTNTILHDFPQSASYNTRNLVVTRSSDPTALYGYLALGTGSAMAVDLRPNSPTYGQVLPGTAVTLSNTFANELVVSSDGSRLILAEIPDNPPPTHNVDVIDTAKMLNDPTHAVVAQLTVDGGITADSVCTGFFSTTPPGSAPTVTELSTYQITNDQSNDIAITGTNFQSGALVSIGGMPQLPTTFLGSTMLGVHVPKQVPAGKSLDIVVTNPLTNGPPDQQNQSGLLAGKFNILPNPQFQPTTQFGTANTAFLYLYDLKQQTMVNVPTGHPGDVVYGMAFNVDGKALYLVSAPGYLSGSSYYVLPVDLSTNTPDAPIELPSASSIAAVPLATGRDPQKGTPVIYVLWSDSTDLHVSKIDSDSSSPTYNTIVETFDAGLNSGSTPGTMALSSDGKYDYVWYYTDRPYLGILNLVNGGFTSIGGNALQVSADQSQIGIAPDGKSMLLSAFYGNRTRIKVFDISNPTNPKPVLTITPIPIPRWGFPQVVNYQVIGNKLYAIDLNGAVVVFNFDRTKGDFRERGYVASDSKQGYSSYVFSPDGSYMYVADYFGDLVLVLDTSKLIGGKDPELTNVRSPYTPYLIDVSPVALPQKAVLGKQHRAPLGVRR